MKSKMMAFVMMILVLVTLAGCGPDPQQVVDQAGNVVGQATSGDGMSAGTAALLGAGAGFIGGKMMNGGNRGGMMAPQQVIVKKYYNNRGYRSSGYRSSGYRSGGYRSSGRRR